MKNRIIELNKLAFPILLNYVVTSVFELFDEAIVGHYSVQGFALVGIAASITYSVAGALGILSVAFNIVAADKRGKGDKVGFEQIFVASKKLAIIIGSIFIVISILFGRRLFRNIYGLKGKQLEEILTYFYPASVTILQNMLMFQYATYFKNKLNTKIGVYVTIVSTVVNLFFDYSLVYGRFGLPEFGIAGAAWGSIIGLFSGLLVYQIIYYRMVWKDVTLKQVKKRGSFVKQVNHLFRLYPALLGQEFLESTVFVFAITAVVARLGTEQMAIYKLLDIVCRTLELPAYAYATASQTYALQRHAENRKGDAKEYLKNAVGMGMIVVCLGYYLELLGVYLAILIEYVILGYIYIRRARG